MRGQLLQLVATVSSLASLAALLDPDRIASAMGLFLVGVNGYSQFYAIYVGVRLATAGLALLAARHGDQPILGDLTALFLLAQPAGRLAAAFAIASLISGGQWPALQHHRPAVPSRIVRPSLL